MHADLTTRAAVDTARLPWARRDGLEEKLLELAPARRTALVRLPPRAVLPDEVTDVLVLLGELREGPLLHRTGTYIHTPGGLATDGGCTLFVKQRPLRERARTVVDTRRVVFTPSHRPGLSEAVLHDGADGLVVLLRFAPGTQIGHHHHRDGEELLVLEGEVLDEHGRYETGAWVRQPPGSSHAVDSPGGCLFFTFAHHLADAR